jgi:cell division septation protein DedD
MATEQEREFELVLGNKQLFGVLFIVIVLLAVFFSVGYVMGRNTATVEIAEGVPGSIPASSIPATSVEGRPSQVPPTRSEAVPSREPEAQAVPARAETPPPISVREPQPGQTFWQVSAVARPEAELLVDVLTRKGFRAMVAPGPNEQLFRVLVGPSQDSSDLGKMRADLEQAGFKPMIRKY